MGFKEFLAHQARMDGIARQKPAEPEFTPLSFFDDVEEVEGYRTKYQDWFEAAEYYE